MRGDGIFESPEAAKALDKMTPEERKKDVEMISLRAGMRGFGYTAIVSGPLTLAAIKYWPWFRKSTGVSGRVASAFIPPLFAFAFMSEETASRLARPDAYERHVRKEAHENDSFLHSTKKMLDDNPVKFLAMIGIPLVGTIFYVKGRDPSLTLSQRVMHTRVMGQFSVLALLSSVALYHFLTDEPEQEHKGKH